MAAGLITIYGVSVIQDKAVRCACVHLVVELYTDNVRLAPQYATDPKNPYAAQIAKEKELAAH